MSGEGGAAAERQTRTSTGPVWTRTRISCKVFLRVKGGGGGEREGEREREREKVTDRGQEIKSQSAEGARMSARALPRHQHLLHSRKR